MIDVITRKLNILDRLLISKDKGIKQWWNSESKEKSKNLWLPNTDYSSHEAIQTGESWFSINKETYNTSLFSLDLETPKSTTPDKNYKTIKIQLFPTKEEKLKIQQTCNLFKWYYNNFLCILDHVKDKKYSYSSLRTEMKQWKVKSAIKDNIEFLEAENTNENKFQREKWADDIYHERIPRGAVFQLSMNLRSALSNLKNKNITHFKLKYKKKKNLKAECLFEDKHFPAWIKKIRGLYKQKRKYISLKDCLNTFGSKGGITLIHNKLIDRYYVHLPVEIKYKNESIIENQDIISLDTGVRTFQTGYSPNGHILEIGKGDYSKLSRLLLKADFYQGKFKRAKNPNPNPKNKTRQLNAYKKIKNMVDDLHWKTISFLIKNYKVILLPDFEIMNMVRKRKLSRMTKRLLYMFSFYTFKQRLLWKAKMNGNKVIIVDESFTSKTCGVCGTQNKTLGCKKVFECLDCGLKIDRDVNGARNILLKHL